MVQTVYKDGGAGTPWPKLTKSNYHEWSMLMRLKMQARQLWDAVEYDDLPYHDDWRALEAIITGVPQEMQVSLADKHTAKDAWDSIAVAHIGVDRVRRATLQRLRKEWENLSFRPGEHIEDFALRLATLKQQMILHGERNMDEERAVEKLLRATPRKYAQLKIAIETLLDFQDLTIEEVIGRLKTVDDLDDDPAHEPASVGGKLMLTEEQWLARQKKKKDAGGAGGSASSSGEARRRPRGGRKQKGKTAKGGERDGGGQGAKAGGAGGDHKANRDDLCLNCRRPGHWAKDCPEPRRERGGAAHVAQADDGDAALFLAHGFIELDADRGFCSKADVDISEPRARAFLNNGGEDMLNGWYLDSGATHHMTGRRELFSDLDTSVRGTVRFGDASRVEIQGVGSIVFQAKNGEHRVLQGVYFIPALRNSIMSLGQLDEGGSKVEINHGVLCIWDPRGRLLVMVNRGPSHLYVLHLDATQPVCLAARKDSTD